MTLVRVLLYVADRKFIFGLCQVIPFWVWALEYNLFETSFSYGQFLEVLTPLIKARIVEGQAKRYQPSAHQEKSTSTLLQTSSLPSTQLDIAIFNNYIDSMLYEGLRGKTVSNAPQLDEIRKTKKLDSFSWKRLI